MQEPFDGELHNMTERSTEEESVHE